MDSRHVEQLGSRVTDLQGILGELGISNELAELLILITHPGFTSPVELQFVNELTDAVDRSARHTRQLHDALMAGSRAIVTAAAAPAVVR